MILIENSKRLQTVQLSKTNFLHYLGCPKSLWLLKHKPDKYPHKTMSTYEDKLALEGYEVQKLVQDYLLQKSDAKQYLFEEPFQTEDGLYAAADMIYQSANGTVDIYEVKSSSSIANDHLIDAAFQTITIEKSGGKVASIYIVHLNKEYVRGDTLKIDEMMIFTLVTEQVRNIIDETQIGIDSALNLLSQTKIDEIGCSCLELSRSHHCETFDYFNPTMPKPSIYNLPRISKKKLHKFVNERRFDLMDIDESEVSGNQLNVLQAAKSGSPLIDESVIERFYEKVRYPIYFLDYETYSSAIPIVEGVKPHAHIPFQFSIHVKQSENNADLQHFEYLTDKAELPLTMIEALEKVIGPNGSIVSWHKSFENKQNKEMGILYPAKDEFLKNVVERTIDLEDIFKGGYVDIAFGGSTSIKKVLPIIVPDLTYDNLTIANGTDAMEAFTRILEMRDDANRKNLRHDMLEYCKLDTLAMVKIFEKMEAYI